MKNKLFLIIIVIVVIGGIAFAVTKSDTPIQSHRSYMIKSNSQGSEYSFNIVDEQGNTLKDFAITHTKPMHVIVVRKDLAHFEHLHPEYDFSTGTFTLKNLTFPENGEYRLFTDFAVEAALPITLFEDMKVGSTYSRKPLGSEEKSKTFDTLDVSLDTHGNLVSGAENMIMFTLSQNGTPIIDLEEYLGALGHAVVLREGSLDFIHAHPMESATQNGTVSFMVNFPEAGRYKIFTQFQRGGKVITTDFVVTVTQGNNSGADHTMH